MGTNDILQAIVLPSGVGVRFRDLTPSQGDAVLLAAAKECPSDGTILQLQALEAKFGYEAMVREVTEGLCKRDDKGSFDVNHPENKWGKYDADELTPFTNKDHAVLKSLYMDRNKAAPGEVAAIMGKAMPVVTG